MFEAINQAYARSTLPQEGIKKVTHNKQHEIYDNFKVLVEFQDIPHAEKDGCMDVVIKFKMANHNLLWYVKVSFEYIAGKNNNIVL